MNFKSIPLYIDFLEDNLNNDLPINVELNIKVISLLRGSCCIIVELPVMNLIRFKAILIRDNKNNYAIDSQYNNAGKLHIHTKPLDTAEYTLTIKAMDYFGHQRTYIRRIFVY